MQKPRRICWELPRLEVGSGPRGRWFESSQPDFLFLNSAPFGTRGEGNLGRCPGRVPAEAQIYSSSTLTAWAWQFMIKQLLLALALASATVIIHAVGTGYVVIPAAGIWSQSGNSPKPPRPVWTLTHLVSLLLILHLAEMAVWAAAFATVGVLPGFETSLYYSLKSYTTVGYGDVLPANSWRLLGPIEAAVGVLMLGWSTSIIVAAVQRIYNRPTETTTVP